MDLEHHHIALAHAEHAYNKLVGAFHEGVTAAICYWMTNAMKQVTTEGSYLAVPGELVQHLMNCMWLV